MDSPRVTEIIRIRSEKVIEESESPVILTLDEAEQVTRLLWEIVGHLGADVGNAGYEFNLVDRARLQAAGLQAAILMSVRQPHFRVVADDEPAASPGGRGFRAGD